MVWWRRSVVLTPLLVSLASWGAFAQDKAVGTHHYLYVSDRRLVTVELISAHKAILNYINLGDAFEFIQAPMLMLLDRLDHPYHGRVMEIEDPPDPVQRFEVSQLLKPGQFAGFTILGDYRFRAPPRSAFLKVGTRIIELQPLSPGDFELVAQRIGELDLSLQARRQMLVAAGFREGQGVVHNVGMQRAQQLERYFPNTELMAPVMLSSPMPRLPTAFADLPDPVTVLVSGIVSRGGTVYDLKVVEGIDPELDRLAVDTIGNSWSLLPAISKGETTSVELTLKITFRRN